MSGEGIYVCTLDKETQKKAKEELNEDPQERASHIETFRQWVKAQPHLKCRTDDHFLLRFLRCAKFSQLRAQEKLDNFLTVRCSPTKGVPEWFDNLDPLAPNLSELLDLTQSIPLPGIDDNGRKVLLVRTGAYDPNKQYYGDVMKLGFMLSDVILKDEYVQVHGIVIVLDFGLFSASHLLVYNRDTLQKCMKCWQDVYPTRNKGINYYDTPTIFNGFFELCKYFMREKTKRRLHFHKSSLESLHAEVPKRMLPTEYGGDAGPIADLAKSWKEELIKNKDEFELNAATLGIDESKRPVKPDDPAAGAGWGIIGSFRKLAVD